MTLVRSFFKREKYPDEVNGILPEWLRVDRVIGIHKHSKGTQYLTKWCGLPYTEATWEDEADLAADEVTPISLPCLVIMLQQQIAWLQKKEDPRHDKHSMPWHRVLPDRNGGLSGWHTQASRIETNEIWCQLCCPNDPMVAFLQPQDQIAKFRQREAAKHNLSARKDNDLDAVPTFLNGRSLRDYQVCFSCTALQKVLSMRGLTPL